MEALSLKFRLFGIPVKIEPTFFLLGLLFSQMAGNLLGAIEVMVWVLVAVLVHELGHAFAMKQYGLAPKIKLHMIGGMAYWERNEGAPLTNWQHIWIALAGPLAGFIMGIFLWLWANFAGALPHYALSEEQVYLYTQFFTIYWSVLNLLPVYPLDGGQVLYYSLNLNPRWNARLLTAIITMVIGGALLFLALRAGQYWVAILLGYILFKNLNMLQSSRDQHLNVQVQQTVKMLENGQIALAVPQLHDILSKAKSKPYQHWAIEQLAEYYGQSRDWQAILKLEQNYPNLKASMGYSLALAIFHLKGRDESLSLSQKVLTQAYDNRLARFYVGQLLEKGNLDELAQFLPLVSAHKDYSNLKRFTLETAQTSGRLQELEGHDRLSRILE